MGRQNPPRSSKSSNKQSRIPTTHHRGRTSKKTTRAKASTRRTGRAPTRRAETAPRHATTSASLPQQSSSSTSTLKSLLCGCRRVIAIALSAFLFLAAAGILLWQFLPADAKATLQNIQDNGGPLVGTSGQGPPLPAAYSFVQCTSEPCCNGLSGLCDQPADRILYAGVHNAQASLQDGFFIAPNHRYGIVGALEYGYRAINLDMGVCNGKLVLFHGFCRLGTLDILETFIEINEWMQRNPTEVVMFPLQIDNSADGSVNIQHVYSVLQYAGDFTSRMATLPPPGAEPWPTLGEMVASDKRALVFHYNSEEDGCTSEACAATMHNWFSYASETDYARQDAQDFDDPHVCKLTRGVYEENLMALNAFVEIPSQGLSGELLNTRDFLERHIAECSAYNNGRDVNVVFVDYWFQSDLPAVVQDQNRKLLARRRKSFLRGLRRLF